MKIIQQLKEEILVYEDVSYQTLGEVYQSVYSDYIKMRNEEPNLSHRQCVEKIGSKYNFTGNNIIRIVQIMESKEDNEMFKYKRKLTKTETYNRNKAIFVDFLRWQGERTDFYNHAAEKYGLAPYYVYIIIKYCLFADPKRFDIV